MLIVWFFLHIKSFRILLFGVLCLVGDSSHPFAQPTINPLACCICWAGLLGRAVFPPWNEGPNFGSYRGMGGIPAGPGKTWEGGRGKGKVEAAQGVPGGGERLPCSPHQERLARMERGLPGDGGLEQNLASISPAGWAPRSKTYLKVLEV